MKFTQILLVVILSAVVSFGVMKFGTQQGAGASVQETAYQRVLRTGEIQCGYSVYAPYFTKDATTGQFGGIWHDLMEALGEHLGLKIVWAQEVGLGEIATALDSKRIDVYCGGLWTAGKRVRAVDFLKPSAFEPMLVYVRADDHRFDNDITGLNDPSIKFSSIDGEGGGLTAAEEFPKASLLSLPQMSNYSDMFIQVAEKKADAFLAAPSGVAAYMKNNPGVLRPLTAQPVKIMPVALAVRYGEGELRNMLNQAQDDVIYNGQMEKIIAKSEVNKGDFWRIGKPYDINK
jgi:ABC-type amino acid transport substrate-binding protein